LSSMLCLAAICGASRIPAAASMRRMESSRSGRGEEDFGFWIGDFGLEEEEVSGEW